MKTLSLEQMEKIEGGKFWGTGTVTSCSDGIGGCLICQQDYMLWIKVGHTYDCTYYPYGDTVGEPM